MPAYNLIPLNDLEVLSTTENTISFRTRGTDPYFNVALVEPLKFGWYEISIPIKKNKGRIKLPKLYYDLGKEYNEDDSVLLPPIENNEIRGLVYFWQ
ncbi:MAG TPA: hypothetical protein VN922_04280, partial [Bacteroidia bacterium]|nr:hypothetical protein [Bacteroidia bacterium]